MITNHELSLVETAMQEAVASDVDLLAWASRHIMGAGGKRLRPKIVLLAYKAAGGGDVAAAVPLAAAVELVHTASLIHDDINDHSELRRGQETVNARLGNDLALLVGDFVFVRLLRLIANFDSRVVKVLADACVDIVEGETLQALHLSDLGTSEEIYLKTVEKKTAALFAACSELGGILAGGTEEQIAALRAYGLNLGMAFQLRDDVLDLTGSRNSLGKPVSSDLAEGKLSLAALYALAKTARARDVLAVGDAVEIVELLTEVRAIEYASDRTHDYASKARDALSILVDSEAKTELHRLADFAVVRQR